MQGKKGFWNYTEPITFEVLNVLIERVMNPPTHWQNRYVGTVRQVIEVKHGEYVFYIDNEDGSGLRKIARDGRPDSFHREVRVGKHFKPLVYLIPEAWNTYDREKHLQFEAEQNRWMQENFPEEFKKLAALRMAAAGYATNRPPAKVATCKPINSASIQCDTFKQLSKKKIKKNAQKARRNGK